LDLRAAVAREERSRRQAQARFDIAKESIAAYYTGASEDVLLKQPELSDLRRRLLQGALDFYRKLEGTLGHDPGLKAPAELAESRLRVATITGEIGSKNDALKAIEQARLDYAALAGAHPEVREFRRGAARSLYLKGRLQFTMSRVEEAR